MRGSSPRCLENRFECAGSDRKGQHSIRINDQWRICFEWADPSAGACKRGDCRLSLGALLWHSLLSHRVNTG